MSIEDDITKVLAEWHAEPADPEAWQVAMFEDAVVRIMPLVQRAQAEAAARTLRALSEKYEDFGKREADPMLKVTYKTAAAFMAAEAEHIENEGVGA